jgi:hypothetical protein
MPGGKEEVHRGMVNFEGFQAEQRCQSVYIELCNDCRRSSRIEYVSKEKFELSVQKG